MGWSRRAVVTAVGAAACGLAGCGVPTSEPTTTTADARVSIPPTGASLAFTHVRATGNRVLAGRGALDTVDPVEIPVDGTPDWVLAFPDGAASLWTVVSESGVAMTYRVEDGAATRLAEHAPGAGPPHAAVLSGTVSFVRGPPDASPQSHPVVHRDTMAYVAESGDVVLWRDGEIARFAVDALPESRFVHLEDGRYALYAGRTTRYQHRALGDGIEGSRLVVVDLERERVDQATELGGQLVFEGLYPLVADLDGDGEPEIVTTVSAATDGARLRVYDPSGDVLATGPVYGSGWRHQLAVAPFAVDGTRELAVVRKPHVEHTLEYYRLDDALAVVATHPGYATHTYGSRNIDGAIAGDLDGDGRVELLLPRVGRRTLDAVRRTSTGATTAWSLPLGGRLTTNLTGVVLDAGIAVAAGTSDGVRVWQG